MTIEREPPGIWRAVCDACGDALLLDTEGERAEADKELRNRGWVARPVDSVKFVDGPGYLRKRRVEYHEHDCPDCA